MVSGLLAAVSLLGHVADVRADGGPIRISQAIPYKDDSVGGPLIRAECTKWGGQLSDSIVKHSAGAVEATDADLAALSGRTLHIVVTKAHAAGGGAISGPKWGRIYGELKEDGKLVGNFTLKRTTNRPFTFGACTTLSQIAEVLGEDVAKWLKQPTLDPNLDVEKASS